MSLNNEIIYRIFVPISIIAYHKFDVPIGLISIERSKIKGCDFTLNLFKAAKYLNINVNVFSKMVSDEINSDIANPNGIFAKLVIDINET